MHFQFKNSFSHQIVRCAKGKVALKKNAFLELFLRTIEEDKWNLFEKLGQLRTPTLQKFKFPKDWFDIHIFSCFLLFSPLDDGHKNLQKWLIIEVEIGNPHLESDRAV